VMMREARAPKVQDWLVNYVVKKNPHSEELRLAWSADPDPVVASAGWALTTERVAKRPEGLRGRSRRRSLPVRGVPAGGCTGARWSSPPVRHGGRGHGLFRPP